MEIFDVHRRDVYNFDDYMDLKKPGFGGPSSGKLLKDDKGNYVDKDRKLDEYQNRVERHEQFKNQVFNPTYKAMGGDLVHKQDNKGENPYNYPDLYDNMGIATVEKGDKTVGKPSHGDIHLHEGYCNTDFASFVLESAVVDTEEEKKECECEDKDDCKCNDNN